MKTRGFERGVVIQLFFPPHKPAEELFQTRSSHQLAGLLKIRWSIVAVLLEELRIKITQNIIQRLRIIASFANLEIQQQPENCALVVIRNLRVYRVLILAVELDPRVEARFLNTLLQAPWRILQRFERTRSGRQILTLGDQPRTAQHNIGVIVSDTFGDPEKFGVVLLSVIKRPERIRADSFYVPEVEELVRHEREKTPVVAFGSGRSAGRRGSRTITADNLEAKPRIAQRSRIQVFESTSCIRS